MNVRTRAASCLLASAGLEVENDGSIPGRLVVLVHLRVARLFPEVVLEIITRTENRTRGPVEHQRRATLRLAPLLLVNHPDALPCRRRFELREESVTRRALLRQVHLAQRAHHRRLPGRQQSNDHHDSQPRHHHGTHRQPGVNQRQQRPEVAVGGITLTHGWHYHAGDQPSITQTAC